MYPTRPCLNPWGIIGANAKVQCRAPRACPHCFWSVGSRRAFMRVVVVVFKWMVTILSWIQHFTFSLFINSKSAPNTIPTLPLYIIPLLPLLIIYIYIYIFFFFAIKKKGNKKETREIETRVVLVLLALKNWLGTIPIEGRRG